MAVRGYVLIDAEVGKAKSVGQALGSLMHPDAKVKSVDTVTGPYDAIAVLESDDLDRLAKALTDGIQRVDGVASTTTCLIVHL